MPTFSEYQDVEVELDISVGDFYDEMDEDEKALMLDYILEDQEKKGEFIKTNVVGRGYDAVEFEQAIDKLIQNYSQLTVKETQTIVELAKRF